MLRENRVWDVFRVHQTFYESKHSECHFFSFFTTILIKLTFLMSVTDQPRYKKCWKCHSAHLNKPELPF